VEALAVVHQLEVVAWNLLLLKLLVVVQESSVVRLTEKKTKRRRRQGQHFVFELALDRLAKCQLPQFHESLKPPKWQVWAATPVVLIHLALRIADP